MTKAISVKNLQKSFGSKEIIKSTGFDIDKGDFFCLLGYNGAGKTTIINILTDLVIKDSGIVKVMGNDFDTNKEECKKNIGIVPQEMNFDIFAKVEDVPIINAGYYGVPIETARERTIYLLKKLDLYEKKDVQVMQLSGGMKRRLMIVRALVHKPNILILDEPTAGVDVDLRKKIRDFLTELNNNGTTIFLTTHYLEEAERLCNKISIIKDGIIIENTTKEQLFQKLLKKEIVIETESRIEKLPNELNDFEPNLGKGNKIYLNIPNGYSINSIINIFDKYGVNIVNIENKANKLEQLFMQLTNND